MFQFSDGKELFFIYNIRSYNAIDFLNTFNKGEESVEQLAQRIIQSLQINLAQIIVNRSKQKNGFR